MNEIPVIKWSSVTTYVDIETGEEMTKYKTELKNYITIKTIKKITFSKNKTQGYIEYTKQVKRNPQLKLEI